MAFPSVRSFCCAFNNTPAQNNSLSCSHANEQYDSLIVRAFHQNGWVGGSTLDEASDDMTSSLAHFTAYNLICLVSAFVSTLAAIYQLFPKSLETRIPAPQIGQIVRERTLRQNHIICSLAISDLLASLGVLVRSCVALTIREPTNPWFLTPSILVFCAFITSWIQYSYICTYSWTLIYALDVYLLANDKKSRMLVYHFLAWGMSAVICALGLSFLFYPWGLTCSDVKSGSLPNYLTTYICILLVMSINPVLYYRASDAEYKAILTGGRYSDDERAHISNLNRNFRMFIGAFCVCWLPNIINGILKLIQLVTRKPIPFELEAAMWYLIAISNPLQALFNSIVYRGVGLQIRDDRSLQQNGVNACSCSGSTSHATSGNELEDSSEGSGEIEPLLASTRSRQASVCTSTIINHEPTC